MRLAFFNIQGGVGVTKGYRQYALRGHRSLLPHDDGIVSAVARFVADQRVFVLGCAETEGASIRSSGVDYTERIASASPLAHGAFFPSHRVGRWIHQGNSLHSQTPFELTRAYDLPGPGEPRVMGEAELFADGERYSVFVTHLSLGKRARSLQIAHITASIGARARAVLMGDFNTADVGEVEPLLRAGFQRAPLGPTHPCWRPTAAIDHVLVSPDLVVERARVATDVLASDHLPVVVDVVPRSP
jgi:endonuclease/exonuclease/phosphatase family metal-dependent hydrolase